MEVPVNVHAFKSYEFLLLHQFVPCFNFRAAAGATKLLLRIVLLNCEASVLFVETFLQFKKLLTLGFQKATLSL
jgi:hypothetical protein